MNHDVLKDLDIILWFIYICTAKEALEQCCYMIKFANISIFFLFIIIILFMTL